MKCYRDIEQLQKHPPTANESYILVDTDEYLAYTVYVYGGSTRAAFVHKSEAEMFCQYLENLPALTLTPERIALLAEALHAVKHDDGVTVNMLAVDEILDLLAVYAHWNALGTMNTQEDAQ